MTPEELDEFLVTQRTARAATMGPDGPHVTPVWFVWDGAAIWLYSLTRSQRWADVLRDPRVSLVVDAGEDYAELRGAELQGSATVVGDVPAVGPGGVELHTAEQRWSAKYRDGQPMNHDGRHGWLRLQPSKVVSWDFRKIAAAR